MKWLLAIVFACLLATAACGSPRPVTQEEVCGDAGCNGCIGLTCGDAGTP